MTETIVVSTTVEKKDDAIHLAKVLLKKRLIACAQIDNDIESLYWWQGTIEQGTEYRLVMKSIGSLWEKLQREIVLHHPYDVPEIIASPTFAVSETYQQWLLEELNNE